MTRLETWQKAIAAFSALAVLVAVVGTVYSLCRKTEAPPDKPGAARELVQSPAKTPAVSASATHQGTAGGGCSASSSPITAAPSQAGIPNKLNGGGVGRPRPTGQSAFAPKEVSPKEVSAKEVSAAPNTNAVKSLLTLAKQARKANDQKALTNIKNDLQRLGYHGPVPAND
jgi:hypothetical protein